MAKLKSKIDDITAEIADKHALVEKLTAELKQATEVREKENAEFLVAKKDDEDAGKLVSDAKEVLTQFYSANKLNLAQVGKKQPFVSEAGQAPPPPPPTWEGAYAGKQDENKGIVSILAMIESDIQKDIAKATEEEESSQQLFDKTKTELEGSIQNLNSEIVDLEGAKGTAISDKETAKGDRTAKGESLQVLMKRIADASPGCDYFNVNYPLRVSNRQTEVDGLKKAKIILSGGEFTEPADPNREIKPGDALLSIRRIRPHY